RVLGLAGPAHQRRHDGGAVAAHEARSRLQVGIGRGEDGAQIGVIEVGEILGVELAAGGGGARPRLFLVRRLGEAGGGGGAGWGGGGFFGSWISSSTYSSLSSAFQRR